MPSQRRFAYFSLGLLGYNLFIILWGAFVRATGSGAGCGNHWPLCNGEIIPRAPQIETVIEFSHRLTSGLALLFAIGMVVWAWRSFAPGHRVRRGAAVSLLFLILEALIGAGLVLLEYVAENDSIARAVWMAGHLVNTFLLVGALTLTAWWAWGQPGLRVRRQGIVGMLLAIGLGGLLLLGASGGVTALGDTLFPAGSLAEGLRQDFSPTVHLLVRLRVLHPAIATAVGIYLLVVARLIRTLRPSAQTHMLAQAVTTIFVMQFGAGLLNVLLLAPVWMQLVHLLLADALWIAFVLFAASALAHAEPEHAPVQITQRMVEAGH